MVEACSCGSTDFGGDMRDRASAASASARWQRWGGGGLIAAAVLQGAGLAGYYFTATRMPAVAFAIADGFPLLAATAILLATFPLALGSTGTNGIVGASVTGRIALIAFGAFTLLAPVTRLGFFFVSFPESGGIQATADLFQALAVITGLVASVVIARVGIAVGTARFAMLGTGVIAVIAVLAGSLNNTLGWVLAAASVLAQLATGILYFRNRQRLGLVARGNPKNLAE